jgi:hypothetical protein
MLSAQYFLLDGEGPLVEGFSLTQPALGIVTNGVSLLHTRQSG